MATKIVVALHKKGAVRKAKPLPNPSQRVISGLPNARGHIACDRGHPTMRWNGKDVLFATPLHLRTQFYCRQVAASRSLQPYPDSFRIHRFPGGRRSGPRIFATQAAALFCSQEAIGSLKGGVLTTTVTKLRPPGPTPLKGRCHGAMRSSSEPERSDARAR